MTHVAILTVYDGANFDRVIGHGAFANFALAEKAGDERVAFYDEALAESDQMFRGSAYYEITLMKVHR